MRSRRRALLGSALVSLALVAAACSDVSSSSSSAGGSVPDNSATTINFAINPWDGSTANVAVAEYLLKNQLGYSFSDKNVNEFAQFKALSSGDLDATMEVWPSGHADDYANYIANDNGVVDGGRLGVIGQIGWWIPTYMLTDHPELSSWEGLKQDWQLFQTAESGSQGQILDGDPSYVTFDQAIADNLGLNMKVVYSGSEAAELQELEVALHGLGALGRGPARGRRRPPRRRREGSSVMSEFEGLDRRRFFQTAAGMAAALKIRDRLAGRRVALMCSGGNLSLKQLSQIL